MTTPARTDSQNLPAFLERVEHDGGTLPAFVMPSRPAARPQPA